MSELHVENEICVCTLAGEFTYEAVPELKGQLEPLMERQKKGLIIDASDVDFIDSMGLSMLMRCHAHMLRVGGQFVLVVGSGAVERLLQTMALDKILTTTTSLDAARGLLESDE